MKFISCSACDILQVSLLRSSDHHNRTCLAIDSCFAIRSRRISAGERTQLLSAFGSAWKLPFDSANQRECLFAELQNPQSSKSDRKDLVFVLFLLLLLFFTSSPTRSPFSRSVSNAAWYSRKKADWKSSVNCKKKQEEAGRRSKKKKQKKKQEEEAKK